MNDKELWELMSIICEGQDSEQRRKVEQYITDLQKEIERQKEVINGMIDNEEKYNLEIIKLKSIIKEVREYIENNSLYEQDYDYDYEENLYEYPPSDEQTRKDILSILEKEN